MEFPRRILDYFGVVIFFFNDRSKIAILMKFQLPCFDGTPRRRCTRGGNYGLGYSLKRGINVTLFKHF